MAKVISKKRGRPSLESDLKKDNFLTLRLTNVQLEELEEVRKFLESTQHLRVKNLKKVVTIRDAINYLITHGMTYYKQDRRRKAAKEE